MPKKKALDVDGLTKLLARHNINYDDAVTEVEEFARKKKGLVTERQKLFPNISLSITTTKARVKYIAHMKSIIKKEGREAHGVSTELKGNQFTQLLSKRFSSLPEDERRVWMRLAYEELDIDSPESMSISPEERKELDGIDISDNDDEDISDDEAGAPQKRDKKKNEKKSEPGKRKTEDRSKSDEKEPQKLLPTGAKTNTEYKV